MFDVTLTRNADVVAGWEEEGQDNDNSTIVHAAVEHIGENNNWVSFHWVSILFLFADVYE